MYAKLYHFRVTFINWFGVFITYEFLFMTSFGIKISNLFFSCCFAWIMVEYVSEFPHQIPT